MSWPAFWHRKNWRSMLLWPLGKIVCFESARRLKQFRLHPPERQTQARVIVVGNIVVGGSGKTPFILWLTRQLQEKGLTVGIVSRGYGGKSDAWPVLVTAESDPQLVGDEPVLLAKQLGCPISVAPQRAEAVELLNKQEALDVIISDDGLQHYGLSRDIEIVMIDSERQFGNGLCLPAGPLREPLARLSEVQACVWNGLSETKQFDLDEHIQSHQYRMQLQPFCFRQVKDPENIISINDFKAYFNLTSDSTVQALAGIGNPQRFFDTLTQLGVKVDGQAFVDHHHFSSEDFAAFDSIKPLFMTEKDAVKCLSLAQAHDIHNWWYLEVSPCCDDELVIYLLSLLKHA